MFCMYCTVMQGDAMQSSVEFGIVTQSMFRNVCTLCLHVRMLANMCVCVRADASCKAVQRSVKECIVCNVL